MIWSALDTPSQGLPKSVSCVLFGGDLSEFRPVYTLFTPGWVAAARRERSPRVHSTARFLAEHKVLRRRPSRVTATLIFGPKMRAGYTLCGSESYLIS